MENLKTVNLFDAVPYIAQTRFENEYQTYDEVDFRDIAKGIKDVCKMTARTLPERNYSLMTLGLTTKLVELIQIS